MPSDAFDAAAAYAILTQMAAAPRQAGTPGEARAAAILQHELRELGLRPVLESFSIIGYTEGAARVEALAPTRRRYEAVVVGCGGSTPPGGLTGPLYHLMTTSPADLKAAAGHVVITQLVLDQRLYRELRNRRVLALIQVSRSSRAAMHISRRPNLIRAYGPLPSVTLAYDDAIALLRAAPSSVRVVARERTRQMRSANVSARIPGTDCPAEQIVLCAHYDSVCASPGALDNAGGAALLLGLARCFAARPARRSLVLVWFGAEELGLLGSYAYVRRHARDFAPVPRPAPRTLRRTRMLINLDMTGATFGTNGAVLCGSVEMEGFVAALAREQGLPLKVRHDTYSSDNVPFNAAGVPSISLFRAGASFGHTHLDTADYLSAEGLAVTARLVLPLVRRAAEGADIPFDLAIPEKDRKSLREYRERNDPYFRA